MRATCCRLSLRRFRQQATLRRSTPAKGPQGVFCFAPIHGVMWTYVLRHHAELKRIYALSQPAAK
jgi:hypothetical protein